MTASPIRDQWLTGLIVVFAIPAHLVGLLVPSIYRDPAILLPQNLGTDLMTLAVGIPLLGVAAVWGRGGSPGARVLWLGALAYLTYAYGMYALGVRWNPLFLLYVVLFGLSLFGLILGIVRTDAGAIAAATRGRIPRRSIAGYLILISAAAGAMWIAEEVGALVQGVIPPSVLQFETPTNVVHVFDLAVALPALVIAAVQLLRDRAWGYLLAGVVLIKATTIGLWVVVMIWFSARQGIATSAGYSGFFLGLTLIGVALTWRYLVGLSAGTRAATR